jgi:glutamate formiminotransferase/formiminotetrahydrofolate cyclodeaminase
VEEAAFRLIRKAAELIDMSTHSGEHPRMGATDVCPFVPVQGATMEDCVEVARKLGKRVGELGIPVYLYENAASRPERNSLADVRQGEYEALPKKMKTPEFAPDFGPAEFNARAGATAIGAREFLIAYNINLNTRDKALAKKIALEIREKGKLKRDENGKLVRDADGKRVWVPGRFKNVRGVGWYIEEFGRAQLSFNLTNYKVSSVHHVFDACREEAAKLGLRVTGSELVGLIPLDAVLSAGDHYLTLQGKSTGVPVSERIHTAALSLGLDEISSFDPMEKIVEFKYKGASAGLKSMTLVDFADELSSDSPAPGGGSIAALCGSLSAGLSAMVAVLTWSKKGMEEARPGMKTIGDQAQALKDWFIDAVDRDTDAFNQVLAAMRLPRSTDTDKAARLAAIEKANQHATRVPLDVLERSVAAMELALQVAADGNPNSVSDAGVAGACALAAAEGAAMNVRINEPTLTDREVAQSMMERQVELLESAHRIGAQVRETVYGKL